MTDEVEEWFPKGSEEEAVPERKPGLWARVKPYMRGVAVAGAMTVAYGIGLVQERLEARRVMESLQRSYQTELSSMASRNQALREKTDSLESIIGAYRRSGEGVAVLETRKPSSADPPVAIDTLPLSVGSYAFEVDKGEQRARVWQRTRYRLVADVPCSTGENEGEKRRAGDSRTPSGYAMITSVEHSSHWLYEGERAYGPRFFRFNYGSWDAQGGYDPRGHCSLGAHGTNEEEKLGSRQSHGGVRLPNGFVREADRKGWLGPGVPVFTVPLEKGVMRSTASGVGYGRIEDTLPSDSSRKDSGSRAGS